jgi:lactaldehyde dehydrogenase/glycolaldehyde dehydrogenase
MADQNRSWKMLIDGREADSPNRRDVTNPATGEIIADVPDASPDQADQALAAARRAQPGWGALAPIERAAVMRRIADLIRHDAEDLAILVVSEQGKPITEARGEVRGAAEFFTYFAEFARRIEGEILPSDSRDEQIWIQRVPIGVVVGIIPWNYPAALVARKVAPAMIAGDTIVLKPHELTPLSALFMARLFQEAAVPAGVINVVTGTGATVGERLIGAPDVDLITMTGSVPTGRRIMQAAANHLTPISLELGGKAPFIVMPDADLDLAVRSAITSRFMNCGQTCICNERTFVHQDIYERFLEDFVERARMLRVADPRNEDTDIGPKVSKQELEKVEEMVVQAVRGGARIALGGKRPDTPPTASGNWYSATVLTDTRPDMPIMQDEIFGPVVPIVPVRNFEEAVELSNRSRYGLSAYLFTNSLTQIMRAVRDIDFGELYVNRVGPESLQGFHAGYRQSGLGGDDGTHGLEIYLKKKTVYLNYGDQPATALMPYGRPASDAARNRTMAAKTAR